MSRSSFTLVVSLALATAAVTLPARADIYTWRDANGVVTVSNIAPPDGTRITTVTREAPEAAARAEAAREASRQAQLQALASRVQQLESEVATARQPVAPPVPVMAPVVYVPPQPPIIVNVVAPEPAPAPSAGCDSSWYGCFAWNAGFFPSTVFVTPYGRGHRRSPPAYLPDPNVSHRPHPIGMPIEPGPMPGYRSPPR